MEDQNKARRYVIVEGQKVYLSAEQQKIWDKFINDARNEARRAGSCGQPDYHLCDGDCIACRWYRDGRLTSLNDQNHGRDEGIAENSSAMGIIESPEDTMIGNERIDEICTKLYSYADQAYDQGARILRMFIDDKCSTYEIAGALGIPVSTVKKRLKYMLAYIRSHRGKFF